jgi:hypothetical protein
MAAVHAAVEQPRYTYDCPDQMLVLAFRRAALRPVKVFPLRSEVEALGEWQSGDAVQVQHPYHAGLVHGYHTVTV